MAGDWIKMRINLDTDPRVIAMAAELRIPELHVIGCCWKVWAWADAHTLDGNAIRVTDVTLDRFTSVTGFCAALRNVGWLEGPDGQISFPRFAEHNGQTAKKRGETAIRVAKCRNAKRVTGVTQKVLPEKRREEKKIIPPTPIPPTLNSPEFESAWNDWLKHRLEIKKPMTPTSITKQLKKLERIGLQRSLKAIEHSIAQGYRGVFEPDDKPEKPSLSRAPVVNEPLVGKFTPVKPWEGP